MTVQNCAPSLHWLPAAAEFDVLAARSVAWDGSAEAAAGLCALANHRLDFLQTLRLDRLLQGTAHQTPPGFARLRLALLGSGTLNHLAAAIRVGGLRRRLLIELYVAPFGQWRQEILDAASALYAFRPDAIFLAADQPSLLPELPVSAAGEAEPAVDQAVAELSGLWRQARERCNAAVIQQVLWNPAPSLFGHFDRVVAASPAALSARFNLRLAEEAARHGAILLDPAGAGFGARAIHDPALWFHAKQAVPPSAAPWFGDQLARIAAALRGLSRKVLVLDLDNTLWGGTIGDDGINGIVLGEGSADGEAYAAFQRYAKRLSERGIVLAVSSKNDRAVVERAFDEHPEMVLRRTDFAAIEADWNDKPSALRRIAEDLSLGLDSFVFFDDNPAERALMRRTLPEVAVPETPEAPELYVQCLADAGYFEAVSFTADDTKRATQYAANRERQSLRANATDLEGFLRDLRMSLSVGPFTPSDLTRITQLINKTNQFNLTTRRYTEPEVRALMEDPGAMTFAARLADKFGDNGLTSIVIGRLRKDGGAPSVELESWLMSCRVLGRGVENAMLAVVAERAAEAGADALIGRYKPTPRNGMVSDLYSRLGFRQSGKEGNGETEWTLSLAGCRPKNPDYLTVLQHGRAS